MPGLSVAGMRAGLNGARSGLFMEQIRIIQEMRDADRKSGRTGVHIRPRFGVWENVVYVLKCIRDVLPTHPVRPYVDALPATGFLCQPHFTHNAHLLHKEARTRAGKTCPCASNGEILTRAAPADDVHRRQLRATQLSDVAYMDHAGKAQLCHLNGKCFDLRRPYRRDAVADRSQRESADTVEQAAHGDLC